MKFLTHLYCIIVTDNKINSYTAVIFPTSDHPRFQGASSLYGAGAFKRAALRSRRTTRWGSGRILGEENLLSATIRIFKKREIISPGAEGLIRISRGYIRISRVGKISFELAREIRITERKL